MSHFIEDYDGPVHPDARPTTGDLRGEVERAIDGETPPTVEQVARERAVQIVREFFTAVMLGLPVTRQNLPVIGRRFLTGAWVLNPELPGKYESISLTELARRLGCTAANLSPDASAISRRLGISNVYQAAHDSKSGRHEHLHPRDEDGDECEQAEKEGIYDSSQN